MTREQVLEYVDASLRRHDPEHNSLEIVREDIRQDNDWWYVPVRLKEANRVTYSYYGLLAEMEGELDEEQGLNVLLVPAF